MAEQIVEPAAGCIQVTVDATSGDERDIPDRVDESSCFTIDELRLIAEHFAVPNRAEMTDRADLIAAIRSRL